MISLEKEEVTQLLADLSQADAAKTLGCCLDTLRKFVRKHSIQFKHKGRSYHLRNTLKVPISHFQKEVIDGCMLGDGNIDERGRFRFTQSIEKHEYVEYLHECLAPFSGSMRTGLSGSGGNPTPNYKYVSFQTYGCEHFQQLAKRWYDGHKIVPKDLRLTKITLLHWFCDDGSNFEGLLKLHTNSFSVSDVEFLVERLKLDLFIDSHIGYHYKKPVILIGSRDNGSNKKMIDMLSPLMQWKCFDHKIYWDASKKRRLGTTK
jgi:hypothetical protein